jgi:hypothetical protein
MLSTSAALHLFPLWGWCMDKRMMLGRTPQTCMDFSEQGVNKGDRMKRLQKKNLRQHSVLDWSPTSILSGPCDACLRGSDETRKVHRGMAADGIHRTERV